MTDLFTPLRNKIDKLLVDLRVLDIKPRCIKLSVDELKQLKKERAQLLKGYYYATDTGREYMYRYDRVPLRLVSKDVWTR